MENNRREPWSRKVCPIIHSAAIVIGEAYFVATLYEVVGWPRIQEKIVNLILHIFYTKFVMQIEICQLFSYFGEVSKMTQRRWRFISGLHKLFKPRGNHDPEYVKILMELMLKSGSKCPKFYKNRAYESFRISPYNHFVRNSTLTSLKMLISISKEIYQNIT